jgi:hypothetical protein
LYHQVHAQNSACSIERIAFLPGENLAYIVSYNWLFFWLDVGEVNLSVNHALKNNKNYYHVLGLGKSYPGWDKVFKVRDRYETWIDQQTLQPYFFNRDVLEGNFYMNIKYAYHRDELYALSSYKKKEDPKIVDTIEITACTFDVISVLYFVRNFDFSHLRIKDTVPYKILLDRKLEDVYFRYLGQQEIIIKDLGTFDCLHLSLSVIAGTVFSEGGELLHVWVSNDKNHIPIYAKSPVIVGDIKVRLKSYKGLKYPLYVKIND